MECDIIQSKIVSADGEFDKCVKEHIEHCRLCHDFADEWLVMQSIDLNDDEPPKSIEFAIKSEASQFIRKQHSKKSIKYSIFIATAACFAIAIWIGLSQSSVSPHNATPRIVDSSPANIPDWDTVDMSDDIMEFSSNIEVNDVELLSNLITQQDILTDDDDGFSDDSFSDDDITLISDSDWLI
jgi:hypothetical protein